MVDHQPSVHLLTPYVVVFRGGGGNDKTMTTADGVALAARREVTNDDKSQV